MEKCLINNVHVKKLNDIMGKHIRGHYEFNDFNLYEDIMKP